jgi:hypothetical protein
MAKTPRRLTDGSYLALPHTLINHPNYSNLTGTAVKLLTQLGGKFNGRNNGDLCATWSVMIKQGWKSQETLYNALGELEHYGFIEKTQQGGQHKPSLYAVTWYKIDECKGKLDVNATNQASGKWKVEQSRYIRKYNK